MSSSAKIHSALDSDMVDDMAHSTDILVAAMTKSFKDGKPQKPKKVACPTSNDHRHLSIASQIKIRGEDDLGVLHLGYWIAAQQNPTGPIVSTISIQGSKGFRAVAAPRPTSAY